MAKLHFFDMKAKQRQGPLLNASHRQEQQQHGVISDETVACVRFFQIKSLKSCLPFDNLCDDDDENNKTVFVNLKLCFKCT